MRFLDTLRAIGAMGRITSVGWLVGGDNPAFDAETVAVRFEHEGGVLDIDVYAPEGRFQTVRNAEAEVLINLAMRKARAQGGIELAFWVGWDCDITEAVNAMRAAIPAGGRCLNRAKVATSERVTPIWLF